MFLEVPFSTLAWIGVIILQAIIHFGMLSRGFGSSSRNLRRLLGGHEPCWRIRQDCDDEEYEDDDSNKTNYDTQNLSKEDQWLFQSDDDDDEFSEGLEAHLSQTGDDIIKIIRSRSFLNHHRAKIFVSERDETDYWKKE